MFKKGDVVFVGTKGICVINDIKKNAFDGCDKNKDYYILNPIEKTSNVTIFLPTDTSVNFRNLISKKQAEEILKNVRNINFDTSLSDNDKYFICNNILKDVDIENRIKVLNFLIEKKSNTNKKSFPLQNQKIINTLIDCIANELSYVLDKPIFLIKEELNKLM